MANRSSRRRAGKKTPLPAQGNTARPRPTLQPPTRTAPRRSKKRKSNHIITHSLLLLALLIVGIVLCLTVFFKINTIEVIGTNHYSAQELILQTQIELGDNLWMADTKKAQALLLKNFPYLEEIVVKRSFPPSIVIEVTPSIASAVLEQAGGEFALITHDGKLLERGLIFPAWDALYVRGLSVSHMQPGDFLGISLPEPPPQNETAAQKALRHARRAENELVAKDQREVLRMIQFLSKAIDESSFGNITNVDISNRKNMTIMYEDRILLKLGTETDLTYKLLYAKTLLIEYLHPSAPGILDVAEVRNNRVYYKHPDGYRDDGTRLEDPAFIPRIGNASSGTLPLPDELDLHDADASGARFDDAPTPSGIGE